MSKEALSKKIAKNLHFKKLGFTEPTIFENNKVGFSVQKKLDKKLEKKLQITDDKEYRSLLHFSLTEKSLEGDLTKIPIFLRAGFTLVKEDGFYIDDKFIKNKKYLPIELISKDDYFYNYNKNCLYKKTTKTTIDKIFTEFYNNHIKTTKAIKGTILRIRLFFWRRFLPGVIKSVSFVFKHLYQLISGNKISFPLLEQKIAIEEIKQEGGKFQFYGYETSKQTIFVYSLLHLLGFLIIFFIFDKTPRFLKVIFQNSFLVLIYAITTLTILDKVITKTLEKLFEKTEKLYFKIKFKEIKIS